MHTRRRSPVRLVPEHAARESRRGPRHVVARVRPASVVLLVAVLLSALTGRATGADAGTVKWQSPKGSKIDAPLDRFRLRVAEAASARAAARGLKDDDPAALGLDDLTPPKMAKINRDAEIQIYAIVSGVTGERLDALREGGLRIELVVEELNAIQGWVAYDRVGQLAALDFVRRLKLPGYPRGNAGSVESEGDALLNADDVRALPFPGPYDGTGIRVGIISDGADSRAAAIGSGDLPAGIVMHPTIRGSGNEGTAMMEIVHDLAPGATLYFGGPGTDLEMVSLINWMAANCHVICDDLAFSSQRFFEDDPIATAARNAVHSSGRVYCTAAGNDALGHYQGAFDNSAGDNWHDFQRGGGIQQTLRFTIGAGRRAYFFLQWDDRWGASGNDYDLFIRNAGGAHDLGTAGFDNDYGHGRADALASVASLGVSSLTVTIDQAAAQADPTSTSPIHFTVLFGEPVADFATGDVTVEGTAPGSKTAVVTGSGTTYDVAVSGMTGSGTVVARIAPGVAHNASGTPNAASTSLDNTVTYDVVPLTVTVEQAAAQPDPASGSPILFTVVFSEAVSDFATGDVTVGGSAPGGKTAVVTGGGTTYDVAVNGMTGSGTVIARIAAGVAHDAAGTPNMASTSLDNTVTYDTTPLTVTINQAAGQADPTSASPVRFTVLFSEPVADFATGDVTIEGSAPGNKTAVVTGSGTTYDVAVSGMTGTGTVIARLAADVAHDALGSPNMASTSLDNTVTYDVTPLAVTIEQAALQADPTGASPIHFTVLFSKPVTDFATGDVTIGGTAPGSMTAVVTGSGTIYDVAVSGMAGSGTVVASIAAGVAHDASGTPNTASTSFDNTVTYDVAALSVTVEQATTQADPTGVSPIHFTVLFNKPVTDFATGDVTIEGTAPGSKTAVVTGSGTTYDVAVSGMTGSGTVVARIAAGVAHDASGNPNTASASFDNTVVYDMTAPTVTVEQEASQPDPTGTMPIRFTVLFSEEVADFATGDVTIEGTAPGNKTAVVTGSGTTYDVAVRGMTGSGTVVVRIAPGVAHDAAGNANTASTSFDNTVIYDATPLTVTIEQAPGQADPTTTFPVHFTVRFSEPVTDFASADVIIEGTAPGNKTAIISGNGTTYDVAVGGLTGTGTVIARIPQGVAHDVLGSPNAASTSRDSMVIYDATPLRVSVEQAAGQADPTGVSPIRFTVEFSEAVTDFRTGDVTIGGTAPGNMTAVVTGGGTTYDVAVSGMTGSGTVIASIAAGVAHDALGSPNAVSTSADNTVTYDAFAPTVVAISSTSADATYGPGAVIDVTLTFSEPVTLTGGDLVVTLETGAIDRDVTIAPFALTNTVSGVYTVQAGDTSPDLSVRSIALSGGSLRDWAGLDANLGIPAGQNLHDNRDIVVKTTYTITAVALGNGTITPSGGVIVPHGGTTRFLIQADPGNHIAAIRVNGRHIAGSPYSGVAFVTTNYVWESITADGDIEAGFAPNTFRVVGTAGTGAGSFDKPRGVAVDSLGFLYVSDSGHHRIQRMDPRTGDWVAWGSYGSGAGRFNQPLGLAVDAADNLYVADGNNHRVQRRNAAGNWTTWGGHGTGVGRFSGPFDVAADTLGSLYVADHYNNRVQKRLPNGQWTVFVSSGFENGYVRGPNAVAVDGHNNVLVLDYIPTVSNGLTRLQKFDPGGGLLEVIVASGDSVGTLRQSLDVNLDGAGQLLVADTGADRVRLRSAAGWYTLLGAATLNAPEGLVFDPTGGRLYIADTGNDRVLTVFLSTAARFSAGYAVERDGFRLSWPGEYRRLYQVQYKSSLLDPSAWQPLPGVPPQLEGFDGVMTCIDTNAASVSQRLYRILVE